MRKNNIPEEFREERTKRLALQYLQYCDINSLPIDIRNLPIPDGRQWIVYEYEEAKSILGTYDPLNIVAKNAAARTISPRGSNYYLTIYRHTKYPGRDYYTLAHELGHIVLGHFSEFEQTSLSRGGLKPKEYNVLENEAELFAAELIMPYPVLSKIKAYNQDSIKKICKTSSIASNRRIKDIRNYSLPQALADTCIRIENNFESFINERECLICGNCTTDKDAKYCPICGHKLPYNWGDGKMKYTEIQLDKNGRATICPTCGNEDLGDNNKFCQVCGTFLYNFCTKCHTKLNGDARYCNICGSISTFLQDGLLSTWADEQKALEYVNKSDEQNDNDIEDIPF